MKKRIIGGSIYVALTYITLLIYIPMGNGKSSNLYILVIVGFLGLGLYELYKVYTHKKKITWYFIFYFIVFLSGILSLILLDSLDKGNIYLLILVTSVMIFDTFSYLAGKYFGKHKITEISPNKTYEGLLGGTIAAILFFIFLELFLDKITIFSTLGLLLNILIIFVVLMGGFIGDLLESKLKRSYGVKDTGNIVYGHGGILDRIDSLLVASIFYLIILLLYI